MSKRELCSQSLTEWEGSSSREASLESGVVFQRTMATSPPHELHKVAFVLVFFLFAAFSNWAALAYIHDFVGRDPLPDLVFTVVPQQAWALKLGDLIATFCSLSMLLLMALHKKRIIMFRRVFFIVACLYTLRAISLLCTQLPSGYVDNNSRCRAKRNETSLGWITVRRILQQSTHLGFQDIDEKMLCGDLLFSGHTLSMVISSLTIAYYLPKSISFLRYIPTLLTWVGMACMVISRTHYTVDVLFAYWLTAGAFCLYHAFCEIDTLRIRRTTVLRQFWIFRIVAWLEENVAAGRIENDLDAVSVLQNAEYTKKWRGSLWNITRSQEKRPSAGNVLPA